MIGDCASWMVRDLEYKILFQEIRRTNVNVSGKILMIVAFSFVRMKKKTILLETYEKSIK